MKLEKIEAELADQTPRQIMYKRVPIKTIYEMAAYFGVEVYQGESFLGKWIQIQKGEVDISLWEEIKK